MMDASYQPRVFVMTSNKYLPALLPFSWLMNKYWKPNPQCIVAGFSPPAFKLPPNFTFISLGIQEDFPFHRWSDALMRLLYMVDDEAFILMLEDYWITRPVNTGAIKILYDYAIQFGYVLKIDICADRLYAYGTDMDYGTVSYLDLIKSMPGSPYHMSLWPGIWRRDQLLKCLISNESPHDIEISGTTRVSHMQDLLVLGTRQYPLMITLGLRGGNHSSVNTQGLDPQDVQQMKALGHFSYWGIP